MNIDRSKHNKYTTGAVYGNLTTGGIATDSNGNVTGTGLQYSGNIIYVGGGGSSSIDPDLVDLMLNQNAYSYLNISDGVYTVNTSAKQLKDHINLTILGDNSTVETAVSKESYLDKTIYDATGTSNSTYTVEYKKIVVIEDGEVGEDGEMIPVEVPKWVITIEKTYGTPIFVNEDFDGILVLNDGIEIATYLVDNSRVTVNSDSVTGLISIVIMNPSPLEFTELRIIKTGDYTTSETYTNVAVISGIVIQEYVTVTITQAGAKQYWKLDEEGKLYTTYDVYTTKSLGATEKIWSNYGYIVGKYVQGVSGGAFYVVDQLQNTYLEVDKLKVRKKAYFETLEIVNVNTVGGKLIISPAGAVTINKVEDLGSYYRCYFLGEQDGTSIENRFRVDDLAFSLNFNIKNPGQYESATNHYFWRKVVGISVNPDSNGNHYIDLDKVDCDTDSDIPHVNDVVALLGNSRNPDRQSALIFSSVDAESPRIMLCHGIDTYTLSSKEYFDVGVNHSNNTAYMNVYGETYIGAKDKSSYLDYSLLNGLNIKAHISASSTYGGKPFGDVFVTSENLDESIKAVIGGDLEYLLNQIDGNIESYFYEYSPTLNNYPANTWDTDLEKLRHNGDTFTNILKFVSDEETPDAGKSWRWVKGSNGEWGWTIISDSDAVLALKKAGEALDTADGKRRVFTRKPETDDEYDIGDLWVNATYIDTLGNTKYSNDLLRAKKAKIKGIAFNIADWELASKYTDDTAADKALSAADKALAEADAAKQRLDKWAEDGVISPIEKLGIKDELARIAADKSSIVEQYALYALGDPTEYTTAYTAYSLLLILLSASTPEFINIPSDFQTKLTAYYTQRTAALVAIAEAAKAAADAAKDLADKAQQAADAANKAAGAAQTTIDNYKVTIDDVFQDGVITASEKNRLNSLKDTVNTTLFDVLTTYNKVYNNTNLEGKVEKSRLKTAYDDFSASATALVNAVSNILSKVTDLSYLITKGDIATIDTAYANFNTKYTVYVGALGDANLEITLSIGNSAYNNAVTKFAWLNGLFDPEQTTTIDGAVVTTGVLALGKTNAGVFNVNAGINGISNTSYNGGGPAIWFGGDMLDKDNYSAGNRPANVATSMFRFDGSGYLGYKRNADPTKDQASIWWDSTGTLHANPLSFFVGEETVGMLLASFLVVDSTGDGKVDYVIPRVPFSHLQIGNGYLGYDAANNSVYVYTLDSNGAKQMCNFYAYGEVSAYGGDGGGSTPPSGATYLDELRDVLFTNLVSGQILGYNGLRWVNIDKPSSGASSWNDITDKPSTFTPAFHTHDYASTVKLGTVVYSAVSNIISLPAYPTTLPASDVYTWAKASSKPSYTFSEINSKPSTLSGYGITNAVDKSGDTMTGALTIRNGNSAYGGYLYFGDGTYVYLNEDTDDHLKIYASKGISMDAGVTINGNLTVTGTISSSGSSGTAWSSITGKPTTISGYGITDAVNTSDSRLTNARPASDVYAWAKASTKPSYTYSEVGAPSTTGTGASGTWGINISGGAKGLYGSFATDTDHDIIYFGTAVAYGPRLRVRWSALTGNRYWDFGFNDNNGAFLTGLKNTSNDSLTFKGNRVLDAGNYNQYSPTLTGSGASGNWNININGVATKVGGTSLPTYTDSSSNVFQNNGIVYQSGIQGVSSRTVQLLARWANVINGAGYQTAYVIGSSRGSSGFGDMTFWVSNNDAFTSGNYMTLGTNDLMYWSGHIASAKYITSGAGYRFTGENREMAVSSGRVGFTTEGKSEATGVNVGSLLVSNLWSDYTRVPTNGIYSKGGYFTSGHIYAKWSDDSLATYTFSSGTSLTGTIGWYRLGETTNTDALGCSFRLKLFRNYTYNSNEGYVFDIHICYGGGASITQVSGYANSRLIYAIRTVGTSSGKYYIEMLMGYASSGNTYYWEISGTAYAYKTWTSVSTASGNINTLSTSDGIRTNRHINGNTFLLQDSTTNAFLRLTHNGINWYCLTYGGYMYVGNGVNSGVRIDSSGNFVAPGEITAYSDARLKSNVSNLTNRGRLNPKTYIKGDKQSIGFIALDIQLLYPELVSGTESKEYLSLNYGAITAVLATQVNEVDDKVIRLETRVNKLESFIHSLGRELPE